MPRRENLHDHSKVSVETFKVWFFLQRLTCQRISVDMTLRPRQGSHSSANPLRATGPVHLTNKR